MNSDDIDECFYDDHDINDNTIFEPIDFLRNLDLMKLRIDSYRYYQTVTVIGKYLIKNPKSFDGLAINIINTMKPNCKDCSSYQDDIYILKDSIDKLTKENKLLTGKDTISKHDIMILKDKIMEYEIKQQNKKNSKIIPCPLCRTMNYVPNKQKLISGLEATCSVCIDNKVEIYLPDCGHVCICNTCFLLL
jgi:hypothetical protein